MHYINNLNSISMLIQMPRYPFLHQNAFSTPFWNLTKAVVLNTTAKRVTLLSSTIKIVNLKTIHENVSAAIHEMRKKQMSCITTLCRFFQFKSCKTKKYQIPNFYLQTHKNSIENQLCANYQRPNSQVPNISHTEQIATHKNNWRAVARSSCNETREKGHIML